MSNSKRMALIFLFFGLGWGFILLSVAAKNMYIFFLGAILFIAMGIIALGFK